MDDATLVVMSHEDDDDDDDDDGSESGDGDCSYLAKDFLLEIHGDAARCSANLDNTET